MRSIEWELLQDYVRRGWGTFLLGVLGVASMICLIYGALKWKTGLTDFGEAEIQLHIVFSLILAFSSIVLALSMQGKIDRHFLRPISPSRLVLLEMVLGMAIVAIQYGFASLLVRAMGGHWPFWGPALTNMVAFASAMAILWRFHGAIVYAVLASTAWGWALIYWFNTRYHGERFLEGKVMWETVSAGELATMAIIVMVSFAIAVQGFTLARRNEIPNLASLVEWFEAWKKSWKGPRQWFVSQTQAHRWFLLRIAHPSWASIIVYAYVLILVVIRWFEPVTKEPFYEILAIFALVVNIFLLPVIFGGATGVGTTRQKHAEMSPFLAVLPVNERFFAEAILWNWARAVKNAWLLGCGAIALGVGFEMVRGSHWDHSWSASLTPIQIGILAVGALLASWITGSVLMSLIATGRNWPTVSVVVAWFVAILPFPVLPTAEDRWWLFVAWLVLASVFSLLATAERFWTAYRLGMVSAQTVLVCTGLWLLLSGVGYWAHSQFPGRHVGEVGIGIGIASLAFYAVPALPLAIHWNRHR